MKKRYITIGFVLIGFALLYMSNYLAATQFLGYDIKLWILLIIGIAIAALNFFKVILGLAYMIGGIALAGLALVYAFFPALVSSLDSKTVPLAILLVGVIIFIRGILTESEGTD